jgi:hypothetical protein
VRADGDKRAVPAQVGVQPVLQVDEGRVAGRVQLQAAHDRANDEGPDEDDFGAGDDADAVRS